MTKEELSEQLAKTARGKERLRYPSELMRAVVEHAKPRVDSGESLAKVAEELGMNGETLRRWCLGARSAQVGRIDSPASRPNALTFVQLGAVAAPPKAETPLEIAFPGGLSIRVPVGVDGLTLSRVLSAMKGAA